MTRMTWLLALLLACKQKPADDMGASPGTSGAMGSAGDMGSAMGMKARDAAAIVVSIDAAGPLTPDDIAKRYDECTRFANEGRASEHRSCYADGVLLPRFPDEVQQLRRDPQLVLISNNTIIALVHVTATDAKAKKPLAFLLGEVVEVDNHGKLTRASAYYDLRTRSAAPLATKNSLIAKHDNVELANLATFSKMMEASEKKDLETFASFIADDVVWSVQSRPKDLTKKEIVAGIKERLEKTDLKFGTKAAWAAGDYVASVERVTGTATADSPDGKLKKGDKIDREIFAMHRFAGGKLAHVWVLPAP